MSEIKPPYAANSAAPAELLPCPFCGSDGDNLHLVSGPFDWVKCGTCGAETEIKATTAQAIEAWNRRAKNDAYTRLANAARTLLAALNDENGLDPTDCAQTLDDLLLEE